MAESSRPAVMISCTHSPALRDWVARVKAVEIEPPILASSQDPYRVIVYVGEGKAAVVARCYTGEYAELMATAVWALVEKVRAGEA